uniref:Type I toxin-antitoxin system SymE family toxin n=1 Tax=Steinernema glaseri TaxID=37863 RepID=A0A1I7XWE2_9BILA
MRRVQKVHYAPKVYRTLPTLRGSWMQNFLSGFCCRRRILLRIARSKRRSHAKQLAPGDRMTCATRLSDIPQLVRATRGTATHTLSVLAEGER